MSWWKILAILVIAAIGISGIVEALPHASETTGDLFIDAAILALIIGASFLATRAIQSRKTPRR